MRYSSFARKQEHEVQIMDKITQELDIAVEASKMMRARRIALEWKRKDDADEITAKMPKEMETGHDQ